MAVAGTAWAQQPASALTGFEQNAVKRNSEWLTLATNLEQRLGRLLPCDARIRGAIEETGRASEARVTALTTYWMALSGKSKSQLDAIRRLMTQEEARKGEWIVDHTEAGQERTAVAEQSNLLAEGVARVPALAGAQSALTATTQAMLPIETQTTDRQSTGEVLATELNDLLAASQARQVAIEAQLKFISAEGVRWSAYYAARLSRAQTECAATGQDAGTDDPPRKPAAKKGASK
jgi:hypothetical protein